ncbi:MAG: UDP-N-acetylmuramate--L-alanine ligase [Streptosporangiaceae bacterium]|nr:UDP-N-acetylmuramate--L-alanine ligase [Streptosporangiaceae bacterium]MBV9857680.1 UDP-N-acetylmuramate--L-alanine ligase [Streptosporangiaceae bacterium]
MPAALVTPEETVPPEKLGRVHFTGIGGAGMSGVARIMLSRGVAVSGSDAAPSPQLSELSGLGAEVHVGHSAAYLGAADTLVATSAVRESNPELAEARLRGLRVLHRAAALASVMLGRRVVTVAGTHGKTTTTSMITTVLRDCGADPGYMIGGVLAETGLGAADGSGRDFVAEADESDGSFLLLAPDAAVITNIEADHLDFYGTLEQYRAAFAAFARRVTPGGLLVLCADDPGTRALAADARRLPVRVRTYGESPDADYQVTDVRQNGMAVSLAVGAPATPFGAIHAAMTAGVPGGHNALNAAAAFTAAVELGIPPQRAATAIGRYRGAARRMEPKGEAGGIRVFDSYAHHPTELAADLRAARGIADGGRVIAVFQPHLYSRTRMFARDFGEALGLADVVLVLDVYASREDPEPGVTGQLVADAVPGGAARYLPAAQVPRVIAGTARPGDIVLTMGAGDVTTLGPLVLNELAAGASRP